MMALFLGPTTQGEGSGPSAEVSDRRILVFSKTTGFRHASIPDAISAVGRLGAANGFAVDSTEDSSVFNDERLAAYDAVLFLLTSGDVLDETQKAAFERYIRAGGGFVGVHSASDTEYGWAWYGGLVGTYFGGHPAIQSGVVTATDRVHPSTRGLPVRWTRVEEWYNFSSNPRPRVHVLATLDESTYSGGSMGADHPISWCQFYDGGRAWYTAMGHAAETYEEPLFARHLLGGIRFAAGYPDCDGRPARTLEPRLPSR
jgi:type 1 glutamine amidotransferase